jgi:hypothetical protein
VEAETQSVDVPFGNINRADVIRNLPTFALGSEGGMTVGLHQKQSHERFLNLN